ncbi:FAD-binding monooxygenase [Amycolatopsis coloradensis]|uniref:FAD-binding monooxygenase n=1 Tax=Amycolatopsis coloradensis TaxID=76021 RepID=A0A1R0KHB0_9PSEU|nr:FAD-dependent oxidoreductase [Amycolatopsis coloradensis]OLZ45064.1 FAD-binding monooxygenase [Amycolatopsis coloradensis]
MERYEVVVAGAGPVGLSTALFLADRGVRVLVVDKRDPLDGPPRASTTVRTLELFRSIGLGPALDRVGWDGPLPMRSMFKASAVGAVLHQAAPPPDYAERLDTCSPVDSRRAMTQYELQRLALTELERRGGQVRFGAELVEFTGDAEVVCARVTEAGTGREYEVVASYLVGADGARSRVRELLGVDMPDREVDARLNTAFFRADLRSLLPESATHVCFIRNEQVYCTLFAKSAGGDRWSSHIMDYPGKLAELAQLPAQQTLRLLHAAIGDDTVPIDLIECNAWEAAIGIAAALRRGRVFLVGDAAHVQSSAGGLGMNTGIQDGHNLAWKLAAVLRGQAGETLLDSYEPERRAAAEASLAPSRRLLRGYQAQQDTNQLYVQAAADYLRGMMLYRYDSDAVLTDDAASPDILDNQATPGCRLPHRWLTDGNRRLSTLDLVGAQWTLLTGPNGTGWLTASTNDLQVRQITAAMVEGDPAAFTEMAGTEPDGALLVRPDGFVAWRSRSLPTDPNDTIRSAMHTLLGHS